MMACRDAGRLARVCLASVIALAAAGAAVRGQSRYVGLAEIQPLLQELRDRAPEVLRTPPPTPAAWSSWVEKRDHDIRIRLEDGDEDTVLNWLLLGTSFTSQPPVTLDAEAARDEARLHEMATRLGLRMEDLLGAAQAPGDDERRLFVRDALRRRGIDVSTASGATAAREYLLNRLARFLVQWTAIEKQSDANFETRGLSLDTSLQPNFALDTSLAAMKAQGLLTRPVRRVAVVGAGLDFADKNSGFDFYAPQTVQPFALLDSLRRLGLAAPGGVEIVALDISPRILEHIAHARQKADAGQGYTLYLPLDLTREWAPEFRNYWQHIGDLIGSAAAAPTPSTTATADVRAVRLPPAVVRSLTAVDTNVVTQRLTGETFDLIVATNVLLYYDPFEQALALANVGAMLAPGGVFLTNTSLPAPSAVPVNRVGSTRVTYSRDGAGDEVVWYQRSRGTAAVDSSNHLARFVVSSGLSGTPLLPSSATRVGRR